MPSRPLRTGVLVALAIITAVACGDALHRRDDLGPPLAVLEAQIVGPAPEALTAERLRAGLIWAAVEAQPWLCVGPDDDLQCTHAPTEFAAAGSSNVVPIAPVFPAAFDIPLHVLPDPALLWRDETALFGFADLVLFDDGNVNDTLDLVAPTATESADTVVATSGVSPEPRNFVLYREGELSPAWQLFAALGCNRPPPGFSIARLDADGCWVGGAVIPIHFELSDEVRALICEPTGERSTFPEFPPPPEAEVVCDGADALRFVVDPSRYCPEEQRYELVGCDADPLCEDPEWDLRSTPPDWWPCIQTP